jgi:hypothetical protein
MTDASLPYKQTLGQGSNAIVFTYELPLQAKTQEHGSNQNIKVKLFDSDDLMITQPIRNVLEQFFTAE